MASRTHAGAPATRGSPIRRQAQNCTLDHCGGPVRDQRFPVVTGAGRGPPVHWLRFAGLTLLFAQAAIFASGLVQRRRRPQFDDSLRGGEGRVVLDALPGNLALWRWHAATDKFWATDRFRAIVGAPEAAPLSLEVIRNCIHPDDRSSFEQVFEGAHDDAGALHDFRMCAATAADSARSLVCKVRVWRNFKGRAQRASGVIIDVSEHTRFEAESESQRLQLAHLTRVAILGHLSGALAHELNQPLTSILSNAQAAQRFLDEDPVDLAEVRAILEDIVNDDRRASEVIRRLREHVAAGRNAHAATRSAARHPRSARVGEQ